MNFKPQWLILPPKERDLERLVGQSGTIRYFIQKSPFNGVLDSEYGDVFTYKVKGASHGAEVSDWINTLIGHLDPILDVDFTPVNSLASAELVAVLRLRECGGPCTAMRPSPNLSSSACSVVALKEIRLK